MVGNTDLPHDTTNSEPFPLRLAWEVKLETDGNQLRKKTVSPYEKLETAIYTSWKPKALCFGVLVSNIRRVTNANRLFTTREAPHERRQVDCTLPSLRGRRWRQVLHPPLRLRPWGRRIFMRSAPRRPRAQSTYFCPCGTQDSQRDEAESYVAPSSAACAKIHSKL